MPGDQSPTPTIDLQPTNVNLMPHLLNEIPFSSPFASQTQQTKQQQYMSDWDSSIIGPTSLRLLKRRSKSCSSIFGRGEQNPVIMETVTAETTNSPYKNVTLQTSPTKSINEDSFSPTKQINDDTLNQSLSSLNQSLSTPANTSNNQMTEELHPMMDFIKEIMGTYQIAIENLTSETTKMREELNDQKQQINNKFKVVKQRQDNQQLELEKQLKEQQQKQQKQQNQLKQQLTSQLEHQLDEQQLLAPPHNNIQYETITVQDAKTKAKPPKTNTNNKKLQKIKPANAAAAPSSTRYNTTSSVSESTPRQQKNDQAQVTISTSRQQQCDPATASKPAPCQNNTDRSAVSKKPPSAMVFGSSIVRHVNGGTLWKQSKTSTKINCYPGACIQEIAEHAKIRLNYLKKQTPETAIIHGGGNDLDNGDPNEQIINNLEKLGKDLIDRGFLNVGFSAVTPRTGLKEQIPTLNNQIREMCEKVENFHFINNSYISFKYDLCKDKVHLNFDGVWRIEKNFSKFLHKIKEMKE